MMRVFEPSINAAPRYSHLFRVVGARQVHLDETGAFEIGDAMGIVPCTVRVASRSHVAVGTALPAIRSRGRIEIDVAGARIRIESGVDHATLAMVLAAVRGDK
jgi:hypothetical protein